MDERKLPNAKEFKCTPINAGGTCATAAEAVSASCSSQATLALVLTRCAEPLSRDPVFRKRS